MNGALLLLFALPLLGFLYCALMGHPWVVFKGHSRTSTYLADTVRTLANIVNNFIGITVASRI